MRRWIYLAGMIPALAAAYWWSNHRPDDPLQNFPRVILWAWERPEDFRFLQPNSAGIAYLERSVFVNGQQVASRPRLQPLRYTPGTFLIAVVRIETAGAGMPDVSNVARETLPAAAPPSVRALQIDFDAKQSERPAYGALLHSLRKAMPPQTPLLITALESWCDGDPWISELPVADATPMLFQMGAGERIPSDFSLPVCRSSLGVGMSELPPKLPAGRRLYFFSNSGWTSAEYDLAIAQAKRWK